ncbi:STAS domain-containing protein [Streptomyces sp. NPDC003016]
MADHAQGHQAGDERRIRLLSVDGPRAELALSGEVTGAVAAQIEEVLLDPALRGVSELVFDLSRVRQLDAICAYALVRPLTTTAPPAAVHLRGASKQARRALHRTGAEHLLTFED